MKQNKSLKELREEIDLLDKIIIDSIDKRFNIVEIIGQIKKNQKLSVEDKSREKIILSKSDYSKYSKEIKSIYLKIIDESKKVQK